MKEGVKKSISLILVLTLLVQLLPVVAFGVGDETNDLDISTDSETVSMKDDDAEIVGEEDALREESVKHFRLRGGGYMLVEYETAVHYQTADGSWEEIDNTLQKTGQQYVAQAGDMTRKFAASLDSGFLFETAYQGQSVSMSLARRSSRDVVAVAPDVPAAEETAAPEETAVPETDGQPQEAEQTEADQTQEPAEAAAETDAPQQETAEELPLLDDAAYTLVTSTAAARMENPGAKMRTFSKLAEKDKIQPQKIRSSVAFDNVMDGVSLLYQNYGYNVKESIIIEKPQEQYAYSFVLNLQGLTPTLEADGSVLLRGADGEPVYEIPAPYLADADGATSLEDAAYKLERISGGYLLTVEADPEWMNAPERAYPVTLDPTILLHNKGNVLTTFIRSAWPGSVAPNSADQFVGYRANEGYDACNIYVQFANLPEIPQNCVPISAQLAMYNAGFFTSDGVGCAAPDGSLTVEAHEWPAAVSDVSGLTWYLVHFGSTPVNEETIDYQKLSKETLGEYVTWDITRTVMQWYQKQNEGDTSGGRGVLLEGIDGRENYRVANLIGSGYHDYSPYFAVYYRNPVGLESYYTYQEASAGKAGDLSIHNFTNQFTLDRADVSLSLEPASYALRHIYNSATSGIEFSNNEAGGIHTCDYTSMQVGVGWKLSAQQTVVECKVGDETYLVYNDEDGTEHYFRKTATNTYEDEDGLSLKIVKSTSGGNTIYTMTDMDKYHTWVFHNGYLISVTDNNSNTIYFAYNAAYSSGGSAWKPVKGSASNRLVQIIMDIHGGVNQTVANLTYSGDRLSSVTDYAGRSTNYSYDSGGHLTQVTYADGTSASYEYYSSNGRLSTLYDAESQYGLDITYIYNLGVVSTFGVQEFANTTGAKQTGSAFHAYRNGIHQTSYRFYGPDHTRDTADDTVMTCVLDHFGKTICTYDSNTDYSEIIGASAANYTDNSGTSKTNNRLTGAAAMGTVALNLLPNAGLEQCTNNVSDGWVSLPFSQNASAGVIAKSRSRIGYASLKTAASGSGMYHEVALQAGTTYTFSGYVNTRDITACQSGGGVYLAVLTAAQRGSLAGVQQSPWKSELVNYNTVPEVDAGWEKISVTFTPDTSGTYSLAVVQDRADGVAYCDDMQLEAHAAASNANLVQNGTFASGAPDYWTANRYEKSDEHPLGVGMGVSMHAKGSSVGGTRTSQVVPINYYAGSATFLLSGWGKANSVGGTSPKPEKDGDRYFGLIAEIKYANGETEKQYVSFNDDFTDWQYASGVIIPKQRGLMIKDITVYCAYDYNANDAYFTNISLVLEPAETYSYDSKGNPIAATDGNAKTASEFFADSQRLKSYTTPGGAKHTLGYDASNNLQEDTLAGLTNYTYHNTSGSPTTSMTRKGYSGDYLKSQNIYDNTGRFRAASEDANGVTTEYGYEPSTAQLFSTTAANGTRQDYHYYNNSDRVDFTYIDGKASMEYVYTQGQISDLIRKAYLGTTGFWQHYLLGYDAFGNMTRVQVCASSAEREGYTAPVTLALYTYEGNVNNGRLSRMTYGNGDSVSYTYDAFDRQRTAAYNDGTTYHYDYSSDNALTRQYATDGSGITEQYSYQYDSLGRLIHSRQSTADGALIQVTQHMYDDANRMTSQTWQFGTGLYHQQYSYTGVKADGATDGSVDGTISAITTTVPGRSAITSEYKYNDLRQLKSKSVTVPDQNGTQTKVYDRTYTYDRIAADDGCNRMGTRLASTGYTFGSSSRGFTYTYDDSGNITKVVTAGTSVPKAAQLKEYTYDAQGQIATEKNGSGTTFGYAYDTAGNIRSITKDGTVTKSFGYTNASWPDLLTSVTANGTTKDVLYEGQTRTSDLPTSGNPVTYYNGKDYTFTWTKGRQLASATVDGKQVSYTYDMSGVRTSKTVNGTTYNYTTLSGKVMRQQWGNKSLEFIYDDGNQPFAMIYNDGSTSTLYYYVLNAQGDVIALLNENGTLAASYNYGAWGNYSVHGADGKKTTDPTFIGHINPLRYRGYYYDAETGFYYLQSRYYDPAICRFINAD
ncbi:MAG: RHS repeat-associated core domain-containing protein, partial [Oscillospiraceae bacterium]|nr:RHS repeat-associated core domain-containing protein [Oscillospiraceae bacterium]